VFHSTKVKRELKKKDSPNMVSGEEERRDIGAVLVKIRNFSSEACRHERQAGHNT